MHIFYSIMGEGDTNDLEESEIWYLKDVFVTLAKFPDNIDFSKKLSYDDQAILSARMAAAIEEIVNRGQIPYVLVDAFKCLQEEDLRVAHEKRKMKENERRESLKLSLNLAFDTHRERQAKINSPPPKVEEPDESDDETFHRSHSSARLRWRM